MNGWNPPKSGTESWLTSDEITFVQKMAARGTARSRKVLAAMLQHVDTRCYDSTVDVAAVRVALHQALSAGGGHDAA